MKTGTCCWSLGSALKKWPTASFGRRKFVWLSLRLSEHIWEQWFGRKHEWLLGEHREPVHVLVSASVYVCARACLISSWVAGCRQPGRDKPGWMEGALCVCVDYVRLCACVCSCGEITSQRTWKCVFSCLPARDSKEISRQPNIPLVFSRQKQEVEYQPLRTDATGSGLEWVALPLLKSSTHIHTQTAASCTVTTSAFRPQVQRTNDKIILKMVRLVHSWIQFF